MGLDPYEHERVYKEGWLAGRNGQPKSANPYVGDLHKEPVWSLGWGKGSGGEEYEGYA